MSKIDGPGNGRGKWAQPAVPHRGWQCVNVEDLGEPSQICEMCEVMEIRYVQYMHHPSFPQILGCGLVCAGHMEGDLTGAEGRDKALRSNARKRRDFPKRKTWYLNKNGNPQIKEGRFRITIFTTPAGFWKGVVNDAVKNRSFFTRDRFQSLDEAKRAAFDTLVIAQS
ncbi:hypothetical protein H009_02418 [Agrobacterium tumefaciens str. Cherry 2E-2-2]|nr:hypothetical protein H009_02418 [Agrobacterium tumefaciens str. Cherry 2E-2-2]